MEKWYYFNTGEEIKDNDIVFYTEYDGIDEDTHYADGIGIIIRNSSNNLVLLDRIYTKDNAKTFIKYDTNNLVVDHSPDIKYHKYVTKNNKNLVKDIVKIGEFPKDSHMLTVDYANENYSVDKLPVKSWVGIRHTVKEIIKSSKTLKEAEDRLLKDKVLDVKTLWDLFR